MMPAGSSVIQPLNLPVPLPIRDPSTFRLRGMCGNMLNQTFLLVISYFREPFFISNFWRNICLLFNLKGCIINSPTSP